MTVVDKNELRKRMRQVRAEVERIKDEQEAQALTMLQKVLLISTILMHVQEHLSLLLAHCLIIAQLVL